MHNAQSSQLTISGTPCFKRPSEEPTQSLTQCQLIRLSPGTSNDPISPRTSFLGYLYWSGEVNIPSPIFVTLDRRPSLGSPCDIPEYGKRTIPRKCAFDERRSRDAIHGHYLKIYQLCTKLEFCTACVLCIQIKDRVPGGTPDYTNATGGFMASKNDRNWASATL